mmetsp:Transcript_14620/g.25263  ORF Transcript_14620/g.25263 Transcript_14620/m.25263 type:complete len:341 (-) Transcript_14620:1818-2840(-)
MRSTLENIASTPVLTQVLLIPKSNLSLNHGEEIRYELEQVSIDNWVGLLCKAHESVQGESVTSALFHLTLQDCAATLTGKLVLTTRRILWYFEANQNIHVLSIPFRNVSLHAISTDISSFPKPCIYCQVEVAMTLPKYEDEEQEEEEQVGEQNANTKMDQDTSASMLPMFGGMEDGDNSQVFEIRIVPCMESDLQVIYTNMCDCVALNPDDEQLELMAANQVGGDGLEDEDQELADEEHAGATSMDDDRPEPENPALSRFFSLLHDSESNANSEPRSGNGEPLAHAKSGNLYDGQSRSNGMDRGNGTVLVTQDPKEHVPLDPGEPDDRFLNDSDLDSNEN